MTHVADLLEDLGSEPLPVQIQILQISGCPNVDALRRRVEDSVAGLRAIVVIDDVEGPYPSPTLLVDGVDVTGRPLTCEQACRLDLPNEDQIVAAIGRAMGSGRIPRPLETDERCPS